MVPEKTRKTRLRLQLCFIENRGKHVQTHGFELFLLRFPRFHFVFLVLNLFVYAPFEKKLGLDILLPGMAFWFVGVLEINVFTLKTHFY